ncbi:MAG TPA: hypothetical protein VM938_08620 [Acidimicrobiales bacterium]|nr:hypothetical protein [Acidimicrobiales bacterium]
MKQARTVVLDNEAVQALADPAHRKHRRVLAVVEAVAARNLRRAGSVRLVVPTAVRVEAGWDRRTPRAAAVNRLRIDELPLDSATADRAAAVRTKLGVSVADAHLAAVLDVTAAPHAVITSDADDMGRIADALAVRPRIVAL